MTKKARIKVLNRGKRLKPYIVDMVHSEYGMTATARKKRYPAPDVPYFAAVVDVEFG